MNDENDPDARHTELIEDVAFKPVFIMGNARSGTTILYQLLNLTERFNCVTAYHLVRYGELLDNHLAGRTAQAKQELSEHFRQLGISDARFDGVGISPDFPEEYGFALTTGWDMRLAPKRLPRFLELCRKVQFLAQREAPLLLKNPWDYSNFLYLKRILPQSKFIFIHRDPLRVIGSLLRGMRSLLAQRNAYHALLAKFYDRLMSRPLRRSLVQRLFSSALGARIVGKQVARTAHYFVEKIDQLPQSDYCSLRYEDLCRDPETEIHRILDFLGLPENRAIPYCEFIRLREAPLPDEIARDPAALLKRLKLQPYLTHCGYSSGLSGEPNGAR